MSTNYTRQLMFLYKSLYDIITKYVRYTPFSIETPAQMFLQNRFDKLRYVITYRRQFPHGNFYFFFLQCKIPYPDLTTINL